MQNEFDRLPPHDIPAEQYTIGAMLLCGDDRNLLSLIKAGLHSDSFYQADHGIIFDAILQLERAGKPIDAVLVRERLQASGLLEEIGGTAYLAELLGGVPAAGHGPHYAAIVKEKAALRAAVAAAHKAIRRCYQPTKSLEPSAAIARDLADELAMIASEGRGASMETLPDVVDDVLSQKMNGGAPRIATGIGELDAVIGGVPRGEFTLIGGRPGSGKSQTSKQIVLNVASAGESCSIITVEETSRKVARNALSNFSGVENNRIAYGNLGQEDWNELWDAAARLAELKIWIADKPVSLSQVEAAVTQAAVKHKCSLVVVDYLQLIDPDTPGENANREVTKISKALKMLAKRLNIALIAVCQLNRGNEAGGNVRRPMLRDLRESGALDQDGDLILLLHREDYYKHSEPGYVPNHQLECIIAKHKDGCQATVPLYFDGRTQSVRNWNGGVGV